MSSFTPAGSFDHLFKVLLIGDAGVGKSSILLRFTDDSFEEQMASTIGVDFRVKTVTLGGKTVKLTIWDTAGQEQYRALLGLYFRNAHATMVVFDLTDQVSFEETSYWAAEVRKHSPHTRLLLVGAKADLARQRVISEDMCTERAAALGAQYWETSAWTGAGASAPFRFLLQDLAPPPPTAPLETVSLDSDISETDYGGTCCGGGLRFGGGHSSGCLLYTSPSPRD